MKIVVALGGNALGDSSEQQKEIVKQTAAVLADVVEEGNTLIVTHGNGPQVGMINLAFDTALMHEEKVKYMGFPECGAMSQGYIGYHLQNALRNEFTRRGITSPAVTLVTQVVVDPEDGAFANPTKPIGGYYTKEEAEVLIEKKGMVMTEIPGKGMRRVVPSPIPQDIVEIEPIRQLVDNGCVVITVGGGGIPVIRKGDVLTGVDAVIDKDYSSAKLAELIGADRFVILTAVDCVSLNFGKENQTDLRELSVSDAEKFAASGEFGKGSMLPKVKAAVSFVEATGNTAIIANLDKARDAITGKSGTHIIKE